MHGCYGRSNFSMLFFKADFLKTIIPRTFVEKSLVLACGITYGTLLLIWCMTLLLQSFYKHNLITY